MTERSIATLNRQDSFLDTLKCLEIVDALGVNAVLEEWRSLMAQSEYCELFASADWFEVWRKVFGVDKQQQLACYREAGQLKAVMPMVSTAVKRNPILSPHYDVQPEDREFIRNLPAANVIPVRQICAPINLQSGAMRSAWLATPGASEAFMRELFIALRVRNGWDVMLFPALPGADADIVCAQAVAAGFAVQRDAAVRTIHKTYAAEWDAYWAGRTSHFRSRHRAAWARLKKLGAERVAVLTDPADLSVGLEQMFALARESWKSSGREDQAVYLPLTDQAEAFYRELCQRYAARQKCQLYMLYIDDEPVAGLLAFTEGDRSFAMQTYFHPKVAKVSPGRFLFAQMVDWCCQNSKMIDWNGNSTIVKMFSDQSLSYDRVTVFNQRLYPSGLRLLSEAAKAVQLKLKTMRKSQAAGEGIE